MNIKHRRRLLSLASRLDRYAMRIRKYVKEKTPRRPVKISGLG